MDRITNQQSNGIQNKIITFAFEKLWFYKKHFDMEARALNKETSDKISFICYIIPKFADEYKMGAQDAYLYLKKYGGWAFLMNHWWALHAENPFWAVRYLYDVCYKNGGQR